MPIQIGDKKNYTIYTHEDIFVDFDMPPTYGLFSPIDEYRGEIARVYTPNPWAQNEIRFQDWKKYEDGIWRRSRGGAFIREDARKDWIQAKKNGWIPRDVIAEPFNGEIYCGNTWDEWASHFSGHTGQFYGLANLYRGYPRKRTK